MECVQQIATVFSRWTHRANSSLGGPTASGTKVGVRVFARPTAESLLALLADKALAHFANFSTASTVAVVVEFLQQY